MSEEIERDATLEIGVVAASPSVTRVTMTAELFDEVCVRMARDLKALSRVCAEEGMPSRWQVLNWMERADATAEERAERRSQYARAREMLVAGWMEESDAIASAPIKPAEGDMAGVEPKDILKQRDLILGNRRWIAERMFPREWGSSNQVRHADADGGKLPDPTQAPPTIQFVVVDAPPRALTGPRNVTPGQEDEL